MSAHTYYELRTVRLDGSWCEYSEGLGNAVVDPITYSNLRSGRAAKRRVLRDEADEIPKDSRLALFKITVEEIPDNETTKEPVEDEADQHPLPG